MKQLTRDKSYHEILELRSNKELFYIIQIYSNEANKFYIFMANFKKL